MLVIIKIKKMNKEKILCPSPLNVFKCKKLIYLSIYLKK